MQALKRALLFTFLCLLGSVKCIAQQNPLLVKDSLNQKQWVQKTYDQLSLKEKFGQLFMMSVASNQSVSSINAVNKWISDYKIGGLIFSKGTPIKQAKLTNRFQNASKIPLLVGMDAEWGLAMRLDSTFAFPWNMTLGAIKNNDIVEKVGKQIGEHAKRIGVHINFAPDVDINTNPLNPIIGNRSFGENRENVTAKGIAFSKGMESVGVLSCAKHFPGHGDTATDSHKVLPVINFPLSRLDSIELYPYAHLFKNGVSSVMVAHLKVPFLEAEENKPSSLSKSIVTDLLQNSLGFKGLIFTDALNMKGVANYSSEGNVVVASLLAGNDVLLMPSDLKQAQAALITAYNENVISEERLKKSVVKVLMAKYKAGLHKYRPVKTKNLYHDLNRLKDTILYAEAIENAITVVKNKVSLLPIKKLENKKIAYVHLGDAKGDEFFNELNKYAKVTWVSSKEISSLKKKLADFNLIIVGFHKSNKSPWKSYKFSNNDLYRLTEMSQLSSSNLILASFAKPYNLAKIPNFNYIDGVAIGYQNSAIAQQKMAQALFGASDVKGVLPVSVHPEFPVNSSIKLESLKRLGYSLPEQVGIDGTKLAIIDSLVQQGIDSLMFPGAQVLVARKGKVIYNKGFGKTTYKGGSKIDNHHMYDLASITKILATLPMVMKMEEEGKIKLDMTFQEMIPMYADSELKDVTVLKSLSHYGRLPAWIAFYISTLNKGRKPSNEFYRNTPTQGFTTKVFTDLYLKDVYKDSIYNRIGRQDLKPNRYRYSDVGYYVFKKYIEDVYKASLAKLAEDFIYKPLGANFTTYNPLNKFAKKDIVPSEIDGYYRYDTIQGYVHDMGAAMQGGVGGHAGLFSNANDVAKIMQMYLQGGYYGGTRFFNSRTVKKFNTCYFCDKNVRRGVGFDKPQLKKAGNTCGCVSRQSFGHSGFTGTYTWADPDQEIVYVFLSNRTYPTASNTLLVKSGLRTRIQGVIYDAIIN